VKGCMVWKEGEILGSKACAVSWRMSRDGAEIKIKMHRIKAYGLRSRLHSRHGGVLRLKSEGLMSCLDRRRVKCGASALCGVWSTGRTVASRVYDVARLAGRVGQTQQQVVEDPRRMMCCTTSIPPHTPPRPVAAMPAYRTDWASATLMLDRLSSTAVSDSPQQRPHLGTTHCRWRRPRRTARLVPWRRA
jgi:hypothetical protein